MNPEITEFLLNNGSNPNSSDIEGVLPIHYASAIGNIRICKSLFEFGGFINSKDNQGDTPLFYAVRERKFDIVRALIQNFGANPHIKNEDNESIIDLCNEIGDLEMLNFINSLITTTNQRNDKPMNRFYSPLNDIMINQQQQQQQQQQHHNGNSMEIEVDFNNSMMNTCCGTRTTSSMKFSGSTNFVL